MDEKNETGTAVEPKQEQQCKQARPHDELICELLDSRRPKTEREHAAVREIERLRAELAEVATAIGSDRYLDPPDGGSVPLSEQVRRMRAENQSAYTALWYLSGLAPSVEVNADDPMTMAKEISECVTSELTWWRGRAATMRAELAVERKRQSAMRTLIASQEGTLSHYRSKQAEADEAVRTLDSERAANATLTAELAECKEDAERYRWLRNRIPGSAYRIAGIIYSEGGAGVDAAIDAARKGEGE